MKLRKDSIITACVLLAIPIVYFYPVLLGQVVLAPGDGWAQNFGVRALAGQMIGRGEAPLWNPFIFSGMPLAASVYPGSFYPPNWLFAVIPAKWAMNLVVLTTYHLALIGIYLYARRIGIVRIGALISGIAFTFGGFMINHLSHTSRIAAAAWLPWILLALENIGRAESGKQAWRWASLGALFIALQFFAGEPQMMVFTALVASVCALHSLLNAKSNAARLRFIIASVSMLICGVLIASIQLLPSLELLAQSERSDPGPAFFGTYSLPPWQLPGLIFPYFFGGAMLRPYSVPYWGEEIAAIMSGYVGMITWLPALIAVLSLRNNATDRSRTLLWLIIAIVSIVLSFGGHLPFGLNDALYHVPGYSTFRGLYRHQFEFTFAMAMLAGLGITSLTNFEPAVARKTLLRASISMTVIVVAVVILYRFFGDSLATVSPRPAFANSLTNPEFLVPLAFFIASLIALWLFKISNFRSQISYPLIVIILLFDLASYGHFFHWRIATFDVEKRLADPPAVQSIKSRERDYNSFRVMSYPVQAYDYALYWPEDPNFDLIDQPNVSILRGLQSISGYDVLRPARLGEITGTAGSVLNGFVQDMNSFSLTDRGLDLLSLKYLIVGHGGATGKKVGFTYDGIYFARTPFGLEFKPGLKLTTEPGGVMATEIAVVSSLANSTHLPDGAPILKFRLHTREGVVIERELLAGRDTSEWAFDRPDVRANIKHQRARVVENNKADGFDSHSYLGRLKFERNNIEKIEWIYAREDASVYLIRASLHDEASGDSTPLGNFYLPPERWKNLGRFDQVEVYENLRTMPRAWFVDRLYNSTSDKSLKAIRQGFMPEDSKEVFDPARTAIIENDIFANAVYDSKDARAKIVRYEPQRIEIETTNPNAGFLVLSEIDFAGWEASVDGKPVVVLKTDYTLRGIFVPAGEHKIEFLYRPASFRNGLKLAAVGLVLLLIGFFITSKK